MIKITKQLLIIFGIVTLVTFHVQNGFSQKPDSIATKKWDFGGLTTLGFSQMSFSNWSSGGDDSYSLNGIMNTHLNYINGLARWDNSLGLAYGFVNQKNTGYRKTDDKMEFYSKYGYQAKKKWFYTGMISFKSQFSPGYDYDHDVKGNLLSKFLSPGYAQAAIGMEFRPNEMFKLLLSPATYRLTMVIDDRLSQEGDFGVNPGDNTHHEFGGSVFTTIKKDNLIKNVNLSSSLGLFSNYFHNPFNIKVDWQLLVSMKINDFLSTSISTQLIYDDDITSENSVGIKEGPQVQFKEVLSVGLQYKF